MFTMHKDLYNTVISLVTLKSIPRNAKKGIYHNEESITVAIFENIKWFFEEMHEANKELVNGVKQDIKEFRTEMKDLVKQYNPTLGKVIEGTDRLVQTAGNVIKEIPKPRTTVPKLNDIFRNIKEVKRESDFVLADHLRASRFGYTHHGLYFGHYQVIHYQNGKVRVDSLEDFKKGCEIRVIDSVTTYSKENIISRAFSRLGEREYNLIFNNCEHFVNWCRSGSKTTDSI